MWVASYSLCVGCFEGVKTVVALLVFAGCICVAVLARPKRGALVHVDVEISEQR